MAILIIQTITLIITKRGDIIANTKFKAIKRGFSNKKEDIGKIEQVLKKYKVKYEVYEITIPESKLITP